MPTGFDVDTIVPENISTTSADFGAEMVDFDDTTHDAARVYFEVDTDNTFPSPTQLDSSVDIGLFTQNSQVLKRGDGLMPDTNYFVRAQAENVVYSDDTLFSTAAKNSKGFIVDVSNKDLSAAAAEPLAAEAMAGFTESLSNLLGYTALVSDGWSVQSVSEAIWNAGVLNEVDSTTAYHEIDVDLTDYSSLSIYSRGSSSGDPSLAYTESSFTASVYGAGADLGNNSIWYCDTDGNIVNVDSDGTVLESLSKSYSWDVQANTNYVLYGNNNADLILLDKSDYSQVFSTNIGGFRAEFVALGANDEIYAANADGGVYAFDTSGNQLWSDTSYSNIQSIDIDPNDGTLFVAEDGQQKKYDIDGNVLWSKSLTGVSNAGVLGNGDVVLHEDRSTSPITVFDSSGNQQASNEVGSELSAEDMVGHKSHVYVGTDDFSDFNTVVKIDPYTANVIYDVAPPSNNARAIAVTEDGFIGVGMESNNEAYGFSTFGSSVSVKISGTEEVNTIPGGSYSEKTIDVSSYSGTHTLQLGLTGYDIGSNSFLQGFNTGRTGSGSSLYVYESNTGGVGSARNAAEFSDLTLS